MRNLLEATGPPGTGKSSGSFHGAKMLFQWPSEAWETTQDEVPTTAGFAARFTSIQHPAPHTEIKTLWPRSWVLPLCKAKAPKSQGKIGNASV